MVAQQLLVTPDADQQLNDDKAQINLRAEGELQEAKKTFNVYLNSIFFVDDHRDWAVGNYGTILSTTDSGATWQPQVSWRLTNLYSITFADTNRSDLLL